VATVEDLIARLGAAADTTARKRAITALAKEGSVRAAAAIVDAAVADSRGLTEHVGKALARMGPGAVEPILARITEADSILASWLLGSLRDIGAPAVEPVRARLRAATTASERATFIRAAASLRAAGKPLLDDVAPCFADQALRPATASAFFLIGVEPQVVPMVVAGLRDPDPHVRDSCALAAGTAEAATPEMLKALEELTSDPLAYVREHAAAALRLLARRSRPPAARPTTGSDEQRAHGRALDQKARRHNWDAGVGALLAIVRDPDCDRGTALRVYWMGRPEFYLQFSAREEASATEIWDLLAEIERRMAERFYAHANVPFDPRCDDDGSSWVDCYPELPRVRSLSALMYEAV
jgi:hypothetical protein